MSNNTPVRRRRVSRDIPAVTPAVLKKAPRVRARVPSKFSSFVPAEPDVREVSWEEGEDPITVAMRGVAREVRSRREGEYLHVSDVIHMCLRSKLLHERLGVLNPPQLLTLPDRLIFGQGDAIHDIIKADIVQGGKESGATDAYGKWRCKCGYLHYEEPLLYSETSREQCEYCKTNCDFYEEVTLIDDEYGIKGHPDMMVFLPDSGVFLIDEIKSMTANMWKELVRPVPEHLFQVVWYWKIARQLGYPLADKVTIRYVNKDWMFGNNNPIKVFTITKLDSVIRRIKEALFDEAKTYHEGKADGITLPKRSCASKETNTAKKCPIREACFSLPE